MAIHSGMHFIGPVTVPRRSESPPRPTTVAQLFLGQIILPGDTVIDATAGNGHDTLFLALHVENHGRVIAFDVQAEAISSTQTKVDDAGFSERVELHLCSHAAMAEYAREGEVAAVMFNLGYLPGADHAVSTGDDTLAALEASIRLIRKGGALSVVCYPGHEGGGDEASMVEGWMATLPERGWRVAKYGALGTMRPAPYLLFATKQAAT